MNTPLIVTPLEQNKEMKIKDGVNAHIVPFDFDDSYDVTKFYDIPVFEYKYDNSKLVKKWVDVIEKTKPKNHTTGRPVLVKIVVSYHDIRLNKDLMKNEIIEMDKARAEELIAKGFVVKV